MRYAIEVEKTRTGYSAFVPDLPGCIATGDSKPEVEREMKGAIRFHIDGLMEDGLPVPKATSIAEYVEACELKNEYINACNRNSILFFHLETKYDRHL